MYPRISWELVTDPSDRIVWEPVVSAIGSRSDAEPDRSEKGDLRLTRRWVSADLTYSMRKYGNVWGQQGKGKRIQN